VKLRRCPRCRAVEVCWVEHCLATTTFDQTASGIGEEGFHSNGADPFAVYGHCQACGHEWRAKGILQITDLPGHPDFTERARRNES